MDVVVQGKDVGSDVRAFWPGEAVAVFAECEETKKTGRGGKRQQVAAHKKQ